jgi:hypothetical protein
MLEADRKRASPLVAILASFALASTGIASAHTNWGRGKSPTAKPETPLQVEAHSAAVSAGSQTAPDVPRMEQVIQSFVPDNHFMNINGPNTADIASKLAAVVHGEKVVLLSERKEVTVDPKLFEGYVGNYELGPKSILTVTREGDKLVTQATGQPKVPIFAESEREFFAKVVDAQITFVTDARVARAN